MAILRDRNNPVRLFARRLGMLLLIAAILAVGSAVWSVYGKERDSRAFRAQAEEEQRHLSEQKMQLTGNIARLETVRGKEEVLRENYELGRRGEGLIIIVDPPEPEPIVEEKGIRQWVTKFLPFW